MSMAWGARQQRLSLNANLFPDFQHRRITTEPGVQIACVIGGSGPPILMLHGYPQTKEMWAYVAADLAKDHTVVAADLRGYGASSKPSADAHGNPYTFRDMANDAAAMMTQLGHEAFHLVTHDRGSRVGHRFALDHGDRLLSLTLMDIIPTVDVWDNMDAELAHAYWHWPFLAQPAPFPEDRITADPDGHFHYCLESWGKAKLSEFHPDQLAAYQEAWRDPAMIWGSTADYRAGYFIDPQHDADDAGKQIACPTLVLYGAAGVMGRKFDVGALWRPLIAGPMTVEAIPGGHFFIDQHPNETQAALRAFLAGIVQG